MKFRLGLALIAILLAQPLALGKRFLEDAEITRAVEAVLADEKGVDASRLEVTTRKGIVLLSGTVMSLLAQERAATAAETIRGVRAVVDRTVVDPVLRPDAEIAADVRETFRMDPAIDKAEVAVACSRGRVTLSGDVESRWEKRICAKLAKGVRGVRAVDNDIEVILTVDRSDEEIAAEIRRRWELSPWIDERDLSVSVRDGHVRLAGVARSAAERSNAHLFSYVAGVREIDSSAIEVKPGEERPLRRTSPIVVKTDERLEQDVLDCLRFDPRVDASDIRVEARRGAVKLNGSVATLHQMKAAEDDARNTVGVTRVENGLAVLPRSYPTDADVTRAATSAFARDPYLGGVSIDVEVDKGVLILRGTVDSRFEREYAETLANGIRWVREVDNRLEVEPESDTGIPSDETLRQKVTERLYWHPFIDTSRIEVTVEDGKVTLSGHVDTYHEFAQASKSVLDAGARDIENRLEVGRSDS